MLSCSRSAKCSNLVAVRGVGSCFQQVNVPLLFGYRFFVPPFRVARFGRFSRRLSHARIADRTI